MCRERWFLRETPKGQKLVALFGEKLALWVLRVLFSGGMVFGLLLATGIVNPVRW